MFSKKTRYALLATIMLAREYGKGPIPISRLSDVENIPRRFLESILLQLKNIGILDSTRGKEGGYFLAIPPDQIPIKLVIAECETADFMPCIGESTKISCTFCRDIDTCKVREVLFKVYSCASTILTETTFADLV